MDLAELKQDFEKTIENLMEEYKGLRAGKASTQLVENIKVDYYGAFTPLNQMSQINTPDPKTITITPWNKADLPAIEKAISESDLGINPNNNGEAVILSLPPMTEERRKDLVKIVNQRAEESRISIRQKREKEMELISEKKKNNQLSEDEFFKQKEEIQKAVDDAINKIDELKEQKEKDIMTL